LQLGFSNPVALTFFVLLVLSGVVVLDLPFQAYGAQVVLPHVLHPLKYRPASTLTPGSPPFVPSDIRNAYDFLPLYRRGIQGNGTRIAIIDAFGDSSLSSDLASFDSLTGVPAAVLRVYYPDGLPRTTDAGWELETALDVEWAHAMAPNATIDLVVAVDANVNSVYDAIAYVANRLTSETVLSMSFGLAELGYPSTGPYTVLATHQLFVTMTSHGTTPFASSGDSGSSSCCNVQYPASDPLVVGVGGTTLTLKSDGSYYGETAWSGSTAGSSAVFSKPFWQQGLGDPMRDSVDVSYDGDPASGVLVFHGGHQYQVGGTSAGAPQWAALVALAAQANGVSYGSMNPKLYVLSSLHDVTAGSNGFFSAGVGWDYPTGMGTPDAAAVVSNLTPGTPVSFRSSVVFQRLNVTTVGRLSVNATTSMFSGVVTVTARNVTTGSTVFTKTYSFSNVRLQSTAGGLQSFFLLNIAVAPYALSSDLSLTFKNGAGSVFVQVTRRVDIAGNGFVSINDISIVNSNYGFSVGSSRYNPLADLDASGTVGITDVSIALLLFGAPVFS
jgi:subtilase family serine protease